MPRSRYPQPPGEDPDVHRMTIPYGVDDDPAACRASNDDTHIPLARRMSGLTGWNPSWIEPGSDGPGRYQLVAEMYGESAADLDAILASPGGQAARTDLDDFVIGTVALLGGDEEQVRIG